MDQFSRTELLLGSEAMRRIAVSHVAVFGIGGVGGHAIEALARTGVGELTVVDADDVDVTNINRQVIATHGTIGRPKAEVMAERIHDINPDAEVHAVKRFFTPDDADVFDFSTYDYVVDAVDTVTAKLALVMAAREAGTPIISAMGAGNKLDPTRLEVADIYETSVCPLARDMRKELRKRGVESLKVVYSREPPVKAASPGRGPSSEGGWDASDGGADEGSSPVSPGCRGVPGSNAFVPAAMGLVIASEVVGGLGGLRTAGR